MDLMWSLTWDIRCYVLISKLTNELNVMDGWFAGNSLISQEIHAGTSASGSRLL